MSYLPCHYLYMSFIFCTCWVPTISVLNLAIFPCYSNLLLRRRRWIGILWRGVLGYVLPRLPFLWCYGAFRYSISMRDILVFKDIIYVIIILYIHDFWSCIRWVLGYGINIGYDTYRSSYVVDYEALTGLPLMRVPQQSVWRGCHVHRQCPWHLVNGYVWDLPLPSQGNGLWGVYIVTTLGPTT
jgi:hypothetical protein